MSPRSRKIAAVLFLSLNFLLFNGFVVSISHPGRFDAYPAEAARLSGEFEEMPSRLAKDQGSQSSGASPFLGSFASLGPGGGGGVFAAVFHNTNPRIILAGQDVGGVGKTTDGGLTWRHVNQGGISLPGVTSGVYIVSEIIAHPTNDNLFFAATGVGLFRSDDVGETWTRVLPADPSDPSDIPVSWVAFSASTPGLALAGTGDWHQPDEGLGIYRSTDDGHTFTRADATGIPEGAVIGAIAFDPADGSAYAATSAGLFRSTDNGDSFVKSAFSFRHDRGQWVGAAGTGRSRTFWYVLDTLGEDGETDSWSGGVYRSSDGVSWTEVPGLPRIQPDTDELLRPEGARVHPADPSVLFLNLRTREGQGGTFRYDGTWTDLTANFVDNETWSRGGNSFLIAPEGLAVSPSDPNQIISCNELAIIKTTDGGSTWTQLSTKQVGENKYTGTGAEVTYAYDMAISGNVLYAAFEDVGIWRSDDRGNSWRQLIWLVGRTPLDGGSEVHLHPLDPDRAYFGVSSWSNALREPDVSSEIYMSTDGGSSTANITPAAVPFEVGRIGRPAMAVVFGPTQDQDAIYAAFHGDTIYKSTDGGATWREVSTGIDPADRSVIYSIAVDPANPDIVYAGLYPDKGAMLGGPFDSAGGLLRSADGGANWSRVAGYPYQDIVAVRFTGSPKRLFVGGWSVDESGQARGALMVSDDGLTFIDALDQPFVFDVIDASGSAGTLYAGAGSTYIPSPDQNAGIYRSTDNGNTWSRLGGQLPHNYIQALAMFPDEPGRLLIATTGDGVIAAIITAPEERPTAEVQPDIAANGSDGPIVISGGDPLEITISLNPGSRDGQGADWWVAALAPSGLYWFSLDNGWIRSDAPVRGYGGPLFSLSPTGLDTAGLPLTAGLHTFYFGLDLLLNGSLDFDQLAFDSVQVEIR